MASINEALKSLGNLIWGPKLFSFSSAQLGDTIFATQAIQNNADLFLRTVLLARLALDVTNDLIGRRPSS